MNNEMLSCAENRDTSENARENKSAASVAKGFLFRFCRGNAERTTLTTLEGWFVPAGYISYFAIFVVLDGRVYGLAAPFSMVRSLARTRYEVYVIVVSRKSSRLLFRRTRMMMRKTTTQCGMGYCETTSSATRNYHAPSDVYLIRCDVVYGIAASRICVCVYNIYNAWQIHRIKASITVVSITVVRWEHCDAADTDRVWLKQHVNGNMYIFGIFIR